MPQQAPRSGLVSRTNGTYLIGSALYIAVVGGPEFLVRWIMVAALLVLGGCQTGARGSDAGDLLADGEQTGFFRINELDTSQTFVWGLPPLTAQAGRKGVVRSVRVVDQPANVTITRFARLRYGEFGGGVGAGRVPLAPKGGGSVRT